MSSDSCGTSHPGHEPHTAHNDHEPHTAHNHGHEPHSGHQCFTVHSDNELEVDVIDVTAHSSPDRHTLHYHKASLTAHTTHYQHTCQQAPPTPHKPHTGHYQHTSQQAPPTPHQPHTSHTSLSNNELAATLKEDSASAVGMLIPALALVPELGVFLHPELRGEERELVLAAAHIEDARTGRGRYGKAKYYFKKRPARAAFKLITNKWFQRLLYAVVLLHSLLSFIEPPSVQPRSAEAYIALCLNLLCLSVYTLDVVLNVIFLSWRGFWTYNEQSWNRVEFCFLCFFMIDWVLLLAQIASGNNDIVQPFRCLRLAMIVCKARNVGHITNVVRSITVKLGGVVFIVLVFIVLYSCIGVHLVMEPFIEIDDVDVNDFRPRELEESTDGMSGNGTRMTVESCFCSRVNDTNIYEGTFNHIGLGMYQLFVLLTTENYPVFMFPAYSHSQWYFVYFGTFLFLGVFFITSILLAVIANLYWQYNKKYVKRERDKERAELVKAWKILDVMGDERLPVDDIRLLKLFRLLKPENTDIENKHLIAELDPEQTGLVNWIYWVTQLLAVLDLEKTVHLVHRKTQPGPVYMVIICNMAHKLAAWSGFDMIVLFLILCHTVLFAHKWAQMSQNTEISIQVLRTIIVTAFTLEMSTRVLDRGRQFFRSIIDTLDITLVVVAMVSNVLWYAILNPSLAERVTLSLWKGCCVVISSLAVFFRLFLNSKKSRQVMAVFFRLIPVMLDLIVLFCIVLYFYGVLGMESFHSYTITSNTPNSNYLQYGCGLGFVDFKCSLFILFQILTTSNWHDIMNTVVVSLDSFAPVVYFIPCYIVINFVIMNLLVAIGIEAFNKFSQEQREEEKEAAEELQTPSPAPEATAEKRSFKEGFAYHGRKFLTRAKLFTKTVFSSARALDDNPRDSPVVHVQSEPDSDHVTQSHHHSDHMTSNSTSYLHSSVSLHRSSETPDVRVNDVSGPLVLENPATDLQDIEDNVFIENQSSNQIKSPPTTADCHLNRQEKMKQLLKERQKQLLTKLMAAGTTTEPHPSEIRKGSVGSAAAEGLGSEVTDEGRRRSEDLHIQEEPGGWVAVTQKQTKKWGTAAQALNFISQLSSAANQSRDVPNQCDEETGHPQQDQRDNSPKFRRGYNKGNWRSEVQNITIINQEEIHELRRQLASKPSINMKVRPSHHLSVDSPSTDSGELGHHGYVRRRRSSLDQQNRLLKECIQRSVDSTLTLRQLPVDVSDSTLGAHHTMHTQRSLSLTDDRPLNFPKSHQSSRRHSLSNLYADQSKLSATSTAVSYEPSPESLSFPFGNDQLEHHGLSHDTSHDIETPSTLQQITEAMSEDTQEMRRLEKEWKHFNREADRNERNGVGGLRGDSVDLGDELSEELGDTHSTRQSQACIKTPLIPVKEVVGAKNPSISDGKSERHTHEDERVKREMPDWVKKLTDRYNLTIHTDKQTVD